MEGERKTANTIPTHVQSGQTHTHSKREHEYLNEWVVRRIHLIELDQPTDWRTVDCCLILHTLRRVYDEHYRRCRRCCFCYCTNNISYFLYFFLFRRGSVGNVIGGWMVVVVVGLHWVGMDGWCCMGCSIVGATNSVGYTVGLMVHVAL